MCKKYSRLAICESFACVNFDFNGGVGGPNYPIIGLVWYSDRPCSRGSLPLLTTTPGVGGLGFRGGHEETPKKKAPSQTDEALLVLSYRHFKNRWSAPPD